MTPSQPDTPDRPAPPIMFEVHPDKLSGWTLYQTGDGGFDLVAWFADKADAEFAREAFSRRDTSRPAPPEPPDIMAALLRAYNQKNDVAFDAALQQVARLRGIVAAVEAKAADLENQAEEAGNRDTGADAGLTGFHAGVEEAKREVAADLRRILEGR